VFLHSPMRKKGEQKKEVKDSFGLIEVFLGI
jgi:hypothetical protein